MTRNGIVFSIQHSKNNNCFPGIVHAVSGFRSSITMSATNELHARKHISNDANYNYYDNEPNCGYNAIQRQKWDSAKHSYNTATARQSNAIYF